MFTAFFLMVFFSGLLLSLLLGKFFIAYADRFRSLVRPLTPQGHQQKNHTPTMGGLFILASIVIVATFFGLMFSGRVALGMLCLILFGTLGGYDDYYKIVFNKGISARTKFLAQWVSALVIMMLLVHYSLVTTTIEVPLIRYSFVVGFWYILWGAFIVVACSNACNLTDGLDGLAASCLIPQFILFAIVATMYHSDMAYANMLVAASVMGFLWYNRFPAKVFMGDVGSLALGAWYAYSALVLKIELLIPIAGIIFFAEELSVMLQVAWYKKFKRRLFKMAPLHHHFELSGWHERSITLFFASITTIACGLSYVLLLL